MDSQNRRGSEQRRSNSKTQLEEWNLCNPHSGGKVVGKKTHMFTRRALTKQDVATNGTVRCRKWKVKTSIFRGQV